MPPYRLLPFVPLQCPCNFWRRWGSPLKGITARSLYVRLPWLPVITTNFWSVMLSMQCRKTSSQSPAAVKTMPFTKVLFPANKCPCHSAHSPTATCLHICLQGCQGTLTYSGYLTPVAPLSTECQHKRLQKDWREKLAENVLLSALAAAVDPAVCRLVAGLGFCSFSCLDILLSFVPLGRLVPLQKQEVSN